MDCGAFDIVVNDRLFKISLARFQRFDVSYNAVCSWLLTFHNNSNNGALIGGNSSVGRAQPCQGWGREFESRFPLLTHHLAGWQSGYAAACKAVDAGSIPTPAFFIFSNRHYICKRRTVNFVADWTKKQSKKRSILRYVSILRLIFRSICGKSGRSIHDSE